MQMLHPFCGSIHQYDQELSDPNGVTVTVTFFDGVGNRIWIVMFRDG